MSLISFITGLDEAIKQGARLPCGNSDENIMFEFKGKGQDVYLTLGDLRRAAEIERRIHEIAYDYDTDFNIAFALRSIIE